MHIYARDEIDTTVESSNTDSAKVNLVTMQKGYTKRDLLIYIDVNQDCHSHTTNSIRYFLHLAAPQYKQTIIVFR